MLRHAAAVLLLACCARAAAPSPERVAVLANADDPRSIALAEHYLKARGVPAKNLVALSLPTEERISRDAYIARLANPLLRELVSRGLLAGSESPGLDPEGRIRFTVTENRVDFLVLCRGVPLKIAHDAARFEAREKSRGLPPQLAVNHASVDSELGVLPLADAPLAGFVPSPWYNVAQPPAALTRDTLRVARLDGPTDADARRLVDNALKAERTGLLGRAYFDLGGGPSPKGDEWLAAAQKLCRQAAFDVAEDKSPAVFPAGARFDAPALYFGWYAPDLCGAFAEPGFRFPPGAIALHIHSFSARTLRDPNAGWTGPLVARGVTATFGNVEEPYLEFTHNPALVALGLLRGMCAGEAAAYASPTLSWQTVFIGDPLYRPFAHDVPAQLADIDSSREPELAHAVIRAVRRLDSGNSGDRANELLAKAYARLPVLALAREILDREIAAGKPPSFRAGALAPVREDAGLVVETAQKLAEAGKTSEARALLEAQVALGLKLPASAAATAARVGRPDLAPQPPRPAPAAR